MILQPGNSGPNSKETSTESRPTPGSNDKTRVNNECNAGGQPSMDPDDRNTTPKAEQNESTAGGNMPPVIEEGQEPPHDDVLPT